MMTEKARFEDRTRLMIRAMLRDGGPEREACLLDLSSGGLMATVSEAPRRGTFAEVIVGRHSLVGQVQWSEGRRFGMKLREKIDVLAVIGNEAGPTALAAARKARGRPSPEATFAYSRHVAQGFTFGILIAGVATGAVLAAQLVTRSLAPLAAVSAALGAH
jgi:hypothetical protein